MKMKKGNVWRLIVFLALLACTTTVGTTQKSCRGSVNPCDQDGDGYKVKGYVTTIVDGVSKTTYCQAQQTTSSCSRPIELYDCDDTNFLVHPGAAELCDRLDNDCDGIIPADETTDLDGDGYPVCMDCDDGNISIYYGAPEVCSGFDNNCDGIIPSDNVDQDGDGYPECADCDDADPQIYLGAPEICDGADNDCDGIVPANEVDQDGDGFLACQDCNDQDSSIYPGAEEICEGLDNDCDGVVPAVETIDRNGNGLVYCNDVNDILLAATVVVHPCSLTKNPGTFSALIQLPSGFNSSSIVDCYANGILASSISSLPATNHVICEFSRDGIPEGPIYIEVWGATSDGLYFHGADTTNILDEDGDGYLNCEDCDDEDASVSPGAEELCNGMDDNCDGLIPEVETLDRNQNGLVYCNDVNDSLLQVSVRIEPESFNQNTGKFTAFVTFPPGFEAVTIVECNASNGSSYASAYEINSGTICKFNREEILFSNTLVEIWGSASNGLYFYGADTIKKLIE